MPEDQNIREHVMPPEQNIFVLSYPRSGSHWLMKNIQFLTKEYWQTPSKVSKRFIDGDLRDTNRLYRIHKFNDQFFGNHSRSIFFRYEKERDFLVVILRNFNHHIFRYFEKSCEFNIGTNCLRGPMRKVAPKFLLDYYMSILNFYDKWPEDRKFLYYYEDKVGNPRKTLCQLAPIFGFKNDQINELMASDLFEIREIKEHSAGTPQEHLLEVQNYLISEYPRLFHKYLTRYQIY